MESAVFFCRTCYCVLGLLTKKSVLFTVRTYPRKQFDLPLPLNSNAFRCFSNPNCTYFRSCFLAPVLISKLHIFFVCLAHRHLLEAN